MSSFQRRWVKTKLKNISTIQLGQSPPSTTYNKVGIGLPFLQGNKNFGSISPTIDYWCSNPIKIAKKNDVLLSVRAPVGDVNLSEGACAIGRGLSAITYMQPYYLFYYIQHCKRYLQRRSTGTTFKAITKNVIEELDFHFPPLPEQRAIVAKIEQLFSELDNAFANLKQTQDQLKVYRQAVLKKAFEGELTREWREHQSNLPSAKELLEQIKEERERYYNKQLEEWKETVAAWETGGKGGKKLRRPSKMKPTPVIDDDEFMSLWGVPKEYLWIRLGEILWSVKDGPHFSPEYTEDGVPFLSGGNIRLEGIDFENVKYISRDLDKKLSKRCKPKKNDLLYTKGGTTGIARVNTYDTDFNVWVHVAVLKLIDTIDPFYLQHALNSNHCYKQSQKYTHGVGNQDLGLTRMVLITLPICSLEEQNQIVAEIESRLSLCDKMEQTISETLKQSESLRQSILKKAFEGRLLTNDELEACRQEPDWEPAEKLLERIKAEKASRSAS